MQEIELNKEKEQIEPTEDSIVNQLLDEIKKQQIQNLSVAFFNRDKDDAIEILNKVNLKADNVYFPAANDKLHTHKIAKIENVNYSKITRKQIVDYVKTQSLHNKFTLNSMLASIVAKQSRISTGRE